MSGDWEATLRYCEQQWADERATMLDTIAELRLQVPALSARDVLEDIVTDAIADSMGPDWTSRDGAVAVVNALAEARLVTLFPVRGIVPGSNEWLAQSPQFHPGDIA